MCIALGDFFNGLLDGAIARTVARALGPIAHALTYQVVDQLPVDPDKLWLGTTERVSTHSCRGYADRFDRITVANSTVLASDLKVVILAETLAVEPTTSGRVVVDGKTLSIMDVRSDPAGATWEIQARA